MSIKEMPVSYRTYYKLFIKEYKQKIIDTKALKENLEEEIKEKHKSIESWIDVYKSEFDVDLEKYIEYRENRYATGKFLKLAKGLFINKTNNYELVADLFNLYDLAAKQKEIFDCNKNLEFYKKCVSITMQEFNNYLRIFYTEVHKQLILEGKGYAFSGKLGWICIARCTFNREKFILNYKETNKRKKELLAKGERIYNKEEAKWCERNGIKYNATDARVFTANEYCYQIPLIDSSLGIGGYLKLEITDYRHTCVRGKTNDDLLEMCGGDTRKICELPIDLKSKLSICDKADKILYTKFIRNENQKPYTFNKVNRKNRQ